MAENDHPPLTWHIALTTVYALTCYTVIPIYSIVTPLPPTSPVGHRHQQHYVCLERSLQCRGRPQLLSKDRNDPSIYTPHSDGHLTHIHQYSRVSWPEVRELQ